MLRFFLADALCCLPEMHLSLLTCTNACTLQSVNPKGSKVWRISVTGITGVAARTLADGMITILHRWPHPQATPRFYLAAMGDKIWEWPGGRGYFISACCFEPDNSHQMN